MSNAPHTYLVSQDYLGLRAVKRVAARLPAEVVTRNVAILRPDLMIVVMNSCPSTQLAYNCFIKNLVVEHCPGVPLIFISPRSQKQVDCSFQWRPKTIYIDDLSKSDTLDMAAEALLNQSREL
jgi:hypothetical protein